MDHVGELDCIFACECRGESAKRADVFECVTDYLSPASSSWLFAPDL